MEISDCKEGEDGGDGGESVGEDVDVGGANVLVGVCMIVVEEGGADSIDYKSDDGDNYCIFKFYGFGCDEAGDGFDNHDDGDDEEDDGAGESGEGEELVFLE